MKIKTARSTLSITWIIGSVPVILIVALQTFNQVYGGLESWDKGWLWIMPLLFSVLGTIIGSWTVGHNEVEESSSVIQLGILADDDFVDCLFCNFMGRTDHRRCYDKHSNWDYIMRSTGVVLEGLFKRLY